MANDAAQDLVVRLYEGNEAVDSFVQILAPDVVCVDWSMPGRRFVGPASTIEDCFLPGALAFEDSREVILEQIRSDNAMFLRCKFSGRFVGEYRGIAPTGQMVTYEIVDSFSFRDGLITSMSFGADTLAAAIALGAIPAERSPW